MIRERVVAGPERARAEGKKLGRPRIDAEIEPKVVDALKEKRIGIKLLATHLKVAVGTIQRVKAAMTTT